MTGTTYVGYNGTGTFNQTGGTHQTTNPTSAAAPTGQGPGTYNYSGGIITGALQNYGRVNVTGGAVGTPNTFGASVSNYAAFNMNQANVVFANAVTNNTGGIFTVNGSNVTFQGTFLNYGNLVSDPSTIIFKGIFTGGGTITASSGDTYEFLGAGDNTINLGPGGLTITNLISGPA